FPDTHGPPLMGMANAALAAQIDPVSFRLSPYTEPSYRERVLLQAKVIGEHPYRAFPIRMARR
ncbi:MAG: hypothetical protein WCR59_10615, partial [Planctomycetota bacterium]